MDEEINLPARPPFIQVPHLSLPVWFIALFALGYLMKMASGLFVWVFSSLFLFALLDPWFEYLKKKGLSAPMASFILVLGTSLVALITLYLVIYFSTDVISELEESKKILIDQFGHVRNSISGLFDGMSLLTAKSQARDLITGKAIPKVEIVQTSPLGGAVGNTIVTGVGSAVAVLTYFCLCPILTLFMMNEKKRLSGACSQFFETAASAHQAWLEIVGVIRGFFLGNLFLFLLTVPLFAMTFQLFSLPSVLTFCVLASLINVIPFVGAVLTGVLPALALLSQTQNGTAAIWLYVICALIHFVVANFITPKILGSRLSLNATVSMISLFVWSLLWGPLGLVLAIPLTASVKALLKSSRRPGLRILAELLEKSELQNPPKMKTVAAET